MGYKHGLLPVGYPHSTDWPLDEYSLLGICAPVETLQYRLVKRYCRADWDLDNSLCNKEYVPLYNVVFVEGLSKPPASCGN